jgi:hypothetical protein
MKEEHWKLIYEEKPTHVNSKENPNHGILREAILNDIVNPRKYWVDGTTVLMMTDIGSVARIAQHPTHEDLFIVSYVEPDLPKHYSFWVNKGTLKVVGDNLRKFHWKRIQLETAAWGELSKGVVQWTK